MEGILLIDHANLSRLDLNLLVAFDALLAEGSVTRAAERVGIGQPSMSHALGRLRRLLKDELFVRAPDGVRPTPRALALADPIRVALSAIQGTLLQEQGFDPAEAERTFLLGMPDSIEIILLPRLMAHLEAEAPKIRVRVRSIDRFDVLEQLDRDRLHLGVGLLTEGTVHHKRRRLYVTNYLCLYDPARLPLAAAAHPGGLPRRPARARLAARGRARGGRRRAGAAGAPADDRGGHAALRGRAVRPEGGPPALDRAAAAGAALRRAVRPRDEPGAGGPARLRRLDALARVVRPRPGAPVAARDRRPPGRRALRRKPADGRIGCLTRTTARRT